MVNDGKDFHGSQFLFTLRENLDSLDEIHTVFGEIVEGQYVFYVRFGFVSFKRDLSSKSAVQKGRN